MAYTGWEINEDSRTALLALFKPTYPDVIAHHVTEQPGVKKTEAIPPSPADIKIIGIVCHEGVEALIVTVDGTTERPIGGTYHITWSLDAAAGRKPVHSNDVIREVGFERLVFTVPVGTTPKVFN